MKKITYLFVFFAIFSSSYINCSESTYSPQETIQALKIIRDCINQHERPILPADILNIGFIDASERTMLAVEKFVQNLKTLHSSDYAQHLHQIDLLIDMQHQKIIQQTAG